MNGTLERVAVLRDGRELVVERFFKQPLKEVWQALTEPERMSHWLAKADLELKQGGRMHLHFENTNSDVVATITAIDAPYLLEYSWDDQKAPEPDELPPDAIDASRLLAGDGQCIQELLATLVRIQLNEQGDGTQLTLSHVLPQAAVTGKGRSAVNLPVVLAAWQNHLDGLNQAMSTRFSAKAGETWAWGRFTDLQNKYSQALQ
ncbi:MAG: SRPBCC domain-containing protein [Phyllobacteriaceae bacterium]|jgi:uncharacterized protein YndB with AHSA1/START domain|nr:SRPBCC domain-containing protein [Phyllobacteriaceae bacterium]